MAEEGYCYICHTPQGVHEVSKERAAIIAEDAQRTEDYYLVDDHINPHTGLKCEGVGESPESFVMDNIDDGPDHDDPPEEGDITGDWEDDDWDHEWESD